MKCKECNINITDFGGDKMRSQLASLSFWPSEGRQLTAKMKRKEKMKLTEYELAQIVQIVGENKTRDFAFTHANASGCDSCGSQCKASCSM